MAAVLKILKNIPEWDEIPRPLPVAPAAELLRKKLGDNEIWKHFWRFFNQTFLSLLTATIILFLTGYILAEAKEWTIYLDYRELFLLLPSHINLAILLELELAYNLLKRIRITGLSVGETFVNFGLVQCRAAVMSLILGFITLAIGASQVLPSQSGKKRPYGEADLFIVWSSLVTGITNISIGCILTTCLVYVSWSYEWSNDVTVSSLIVAVNYLSVSWVMSISNHLMSQLTDTILPFVIGVVFILPVPIWFTFVQRDLVLRKQFYHGFLPLLFAGVLSLISGIAVIVSIHTYHELAQLIPVFVGLSKITSIIHMSRWRIRAKIAPFIEKLTAIDDTQLEEKETEGEFMTQELLASIDKPDSRTFIDVGLDDLDECVEGDRDSFIDMYSRAANILTAQGQFTTLLSLELFFQFFIIAVYFLANIGEHNSTIVFPVTYLLIYVFFSTIALVVAGYSSRTLTKYCSSAFVLATVVSINSIIGVLSLIGALWILFSRAKPVHLGVPILRKP